MKNIVPLLLFVFYTSTAFALDGRVVGVTDGDTIKLIDAGNNLYKIRLHGIDAPEKNQAFGQASKQHLSDLVFNRMVTSGSTAKTVMGGF